MSPALIRTLQALPNALAEHLLVAASALGIGLALSLPLALAVVHRPALRNPVLATVSVIQTIPGLALLALMVPLLDTFGFWPAVTALALYSMLPIVRNTVTGVLAVDPRVTEAADALGMTPRQKMLRVEMPLAAPMIVAGLRTATVWVVGMATLSTPVGQTSLGNFIFRGLQTRNWTEIVVGCIAAALLAIGLDRIIGMAEAAARTRSRRRAVVAAALFALVFGVGLAPFAVTRSSAPPAVGPDRPSPTATSPDRPLLRPVRVGAKAFTEQYILAGLIERTLAARGLATERVEGLGSSVVFDALRQDDLDVYVDYSGTLWANHMKRTDAPPDWRVLDELSAWLVREHGIRALGPIGFENAYALALRRGTTERLGLRTIGDLAPHAPSLSIGSDYEFFGRPEWTRVRTTYGLEFGSRRTFDPTFMYDAVRDREVDVVTAFSSDGRIAAYDLVVLDDPRRAFPPYDAVLLLAPGVADEPSLVEALLPLIGAIDVVTMRSANAVVDVERRGVGDAVEWLEGELDVRR